MLPRIACFTYTPGGIATVSSVGMTVFSGISVTPSAISTTGTFAISTTLSGILKGTGSGFTAATAGTDFIAPVSETVTLPFTAASGSGPLVLSFSNGAFAGKLLTVKDHSGTTITSIDYDGCIYIGPSRSVQLLSSVVVSPSFQVGSLELGVAWSTGTVDPEGLVDAGVGSLYSRIDGGSGASLYVKETGGTGNTGWVAK